MKIAPQIPVHGPAFQRIPVRIDSTSIPALPVPCRNAARRSHIGRRLSSTNQNRQHRHAFEKYEPSAQLAANKDGDERHRSVIHRRSDRPEPNAMAGLETRSTSDLLRTMTCASQRHIIGCFYCGMRATKDCPHSRQDRATPDGGTDHMRVVICLPRRDLSKKSHLSLEPLTA